MYSADWLRRRPGELGQRFDRCDYLRSVDPNRIGGTMSTRDQGEANSNRKIKYWMLQKTARVCYENIVDAGGTFRVY